MSRKDSINRRISKDLDNKIRKEQKKIEKKKKKKITYLDVSRLIANVDLGDYYDFDDFL